MLYYCVRANLKTPIVLIILIFLYRINDDLVIRGVYDGHNPSQLEIFVNSCFLMVIKIVILQANVATNCCAFPAILIYKFKDVVNTISPTSPEGPEDKL